MRSAFDWFILTIDTSYEIQPDCNTLSFVLVEGEEEPFLSLCIINDTQFGFGHRLKNI